MECRWYGQRRRRRAALLLTAAVMSGLACSARLLQPSTVEGPPRMYWLIEVEGLADVTPQDAPPVVEQGECRWHVNREGYLWGDYWGWCEDFTILPRWSPGYLLATTVYTGAISGGFSRLLVLPPLPASLTLFHLPARLARMPHAILQMTLGDWAAEVAPGGEVRLGSRVTLVEAPQETKYGNELDPRPIQATVTFTVRNYGDLPSQRLGGGRLPVRT